ncbi:MAG TPA: acyclic terpene utilization AtuA family protein [Ramlibacter sp.]|nr:acyclic terpene utilization AtuA family protein [Ramlibacter sp.]
MAARTICRIGAGAGFAGDRVDPAVELAASGQVDTVALECLAERTLLPAIKARNADPDAGYDPRLRRRLQPLLPVAHANRCRIVSNLGQANPRAAGEAIARMARELGCGGARVAAVLGDDVVGLREQIAWDRPVTGALVGAHAYLGAEPLAQALEDGASVVVTGRVADSALFAAPALQRLDAVPHALAGALAVGHLMECSGQLSGGNFAPVGGALLSAEAYARLGFPLAEVYADGSAEIRLLDGAHGVLTPETCTLQLLYEVHDPSRYITPDVTLDFTALQFEVSGPNRVRMHGARGAGQPTTLKVAGFMELPGFIMDCEIGFAGTGALDRARRTAEALRLRLSDWLDEDIAIDLVGVDSILRAGSAPTLAPPAEVRVHVSARCADAEAAQVVEDEVYAMTLSGPAGGCSIRSEKRARIEVIDGYIARELVQPRIEWSIA